MKRHILALPLFALAACGTADRTTADAAESSSARKLATAETASSAALDAPANSIRHLSTQAKMQIAFQKVLDQRVVRKRDTKPLAFLETSFGPVLMTGTTMLQGGKSGYGEFSFENKTALPTSVYGTENSLHMETRTADIDNDGDLDLIISYSRYVPYYGGDYLQILRNDAGQFLDITSTAIKQADADVYGQRLDWSPALYITDLNKDGKADIVFARQDGTLRMYINEGGSTFRNVNASLPKNEGWGKLIGFDDFDGDGSPEAVYWQYGGTPDRKDYFINLYELTFA